MTIGLAMRLTALASVAMVSLAAAALRPVQPPSHRPVRVLLGSARIDVTLGVPSGWQLLEDDRVALRDGAAGSVVIQRSGRRLRAMRPDGRALTEWFAGWIVLESPSADEVLSWEGRTWRGALVLVAHDSALLVVNRVEVEEYLRGVVPLEVGALRPDEHAAVSAQAVAARSFTYTRMLSAGSREWDLTATDSDQVYGGSAVETFIGDLAVDATAGWVLSVSGRVVIAPYHAVCGGETSRPSETWRGGNDDFLRPVSDARDGSARAWCEISPRFAWERRITVDALAGSVARHGPAYQRDASGVRQVRALTADVAPSGRVRTVRLDTDRGLLQFTANEIRFVLRPDGVEVLPSTLFTVEEDRGADGQVRGWILRGRGHGHGVGMCQWGAIARAREGQDFRAILKAYYPGAELTRAP